LIEGRLQAQADGQAAVDTPIGIWPVSAGGTAAQPGDEVVMRLRAEGVRKRKQAKGSTD
jgi:hypothetical protein